MLESLRVGVGVGMGGGGGGVCVFVSVYLDVSKSNATIYILFDGLGVRGGVVGVKPCLCHRVARRVALRVYIYIYIYVLCAYICTVCRVIPHRHTKLITFCVSPCSYCYVIVNRF